MLSNKSGILSVGTAENARRIKPDKTITPGVKVFGIGNSNSNKSLKGVK